MESVSEEKVDIVNKVKELFKCDICDSKLSSKAHLTRHIAHVHFAAIHEKKIFFKCEVCGKSYPDKGKLNRHVAMAHEGKKPNKKCNISHYII